MLTTHNPRPALQAALFTEQGQYRAEDIVIRTVDGLPGVSLREILEIRPNKKDGTLTIRVNSKEAERLALEQWLGEAEAGHEFQGPHPFRELTAVFEREITLFRIEAMLRERIQVLGLSPMQPAFYPETGRWDAAHQKILTFFLPYGSQISGDRVLMGKCLGAALQESVSVNAAAPLQLQANAAAAGNCTLDSGIQAGGQHLSTRPCLEVVIGPVAQERLGDYVPGARQRQFLEEALLPLFAGSGTDWRIRVTAESGSDGPAVAEPGRPLHLDINSFVA